MTEECMREVWVGDTYYGRCLLPPHHPGYCRTTETKRVDKRGE